MAAEQRPIENEATIGEYLARWLPENNKVFSSVSPELSRKIVDAFSKSKHASRIDLEGSMWRHCGYEQGNIQGCFIGFAEKWLKKNEPEHPVVKYFDVRMEAIRANYSQALGLE